MPKNPYYQKPKYRGTPQGKPIPGREAEMERNAAGGYGFKLDAWQQLARFLILGSEAGTYYVGAFRLTQVNADNVIRLLAEDGKRVVRMAYNVNMQGRAPKVDPQLFAMALALRHGDRQTRGLARRMVQGMLRTASHLFTFNAMLDAVGKGWGRLRREVGQDWYRSRTIADLAYQMVKYRQRNGYSHEKLIRLAHVKPKDAAQSAVFAWATGNETDPRYLPAVLRAFERAQEAKSVRDVIPLILDYKLPWEAVPTNLLNEPALWRALFKAKALPPHAMLRNLGRFTAIGLLDDWDFKDAVLDAIADGTRARRNRVHPFQYFITMKGYMAGGRHNHFTPDGNVVGALSEQFYAAFGNAEPIKGDVLLAIDASGSMWWPGSMAVGVSGVKNAEAAAAMALLFKKTARHADAVAFDTRARPLPIHKNDTLESVERKMKGVGGGGTDVARPILQALENGKKYDAFVILTDNETWAGSIHPTEVLDEYRRKINPRAKMVVLAFNAGKASVIDPQDGGQMMTVGLDSAVPNIVANFLNEEM